MKKILFILLAPFALLSMEKGVEPFLFIDPISPMTLSRMDVHTYLTFPWKESYFMLSPRIGAHFNGDVDLSIGSGFRHQIGENTLGYHMFWDFSALKPASFHQVGPSIEFMTPKADFRVNYYHPVSVKRRRAGVEYVPQKWVEAEAVWKTEFFNVGAGPVYHLNRHAIGAKLVLAVPFERFTVASGVYFEKHQRPTSFVSVGIPLYSIASSAVGRTPRVKCVARKGVFIPRAIRKEAEEEIEVLNEPKDSSSEEICDLQLEPTVLNSHPVASKIGYYTPKKVREFLKAHPELVGRNTLNFPED